MIFWEKFKHCIVRASIFQQQYFMKACNQLVKGDKSKYIFTLMEQTLRKTKQKNVALPRFSLIQILQTGSSASVREAEGRSL